MHPPTRTTPVAPALPQARGPLSDELITALRDGTEIDSAALRRTAVDEADPFGDDVQLALYVAYELHYAGFADVDDDREWDPGILGLRRDLERILLDAVHANVDTEEASPGQTRTGQTSAEQLMADLSVEPVHGDGLSYRLRDDGTWQQFRDLFALRSLYHLKEADPHAWAIPRLRGTAKAAFVAVEFDEFGAGRGESVHQELFADLMVAADLDPGYLAYLDRAPAWALTPVNLMSCFGLHRSMRGATVGHFAATEITSSPGSQRLLTGLERLDAPEPCKYFYREHVEADAVHEQVLRRDVVGALVSEEPELEDDVIFGIRGFLFVEDAFEAGLTAAWKAGPVLAGVAPVAV
ncbi:iron-containing redox enzyme family protein [Gordonia sp. DT219]|uniref:iron-containing redox enzyme family protein n=1 Tax=Gordonia sp. DT219 TaxID=3416658 RepID=UPI003CECED47